MPEYAVACAACRQHLVTTSRVADPEIAVLEAHFRLCRASKLLADAPRLAAILRGVVVTVVTDVRAPV